MKKTIFIFLSFVFLLSDCNKSSSTGSSYTTSAIKEINNETIYYQNGKESSFNGDVILFHIWELFGARINLGSVEKGKLTITLPDIDTIEGIPPNKINKIQDYFNDTNIKIIPENAEWFPLINPLNPNGGTPHARIVVFSDDEEHSVWNHDEIFNVYYTLSLSDNSDDNFLIFVFFTKDTTIKGKEKISYYGGTYEYDVDIKVKRGWNKIYTQELESGIIVKSTPINNQNFKWTTSKETLFF
jgi:hypothetical protein